MSDNISIETIDDAPTIVEVNATVVEEVINVEVTESPDTPIVEVHVDENSAQAAIDAAALAQSILDNIIDVIANMPVPNLQSVSEAGASTDRILYLAGLVLDSKLNFITTLITQIRNVRFQDKDGDVALTSDIATLSQNIASKQSVELNLTDADVIKSGGLPRISGLTKQGHTLVQGSRVLVTGPSFSAWNGFFRVSTGPDQFGQYILNRTSDALTTASLNNALASVTNGTFAGKTFIQTTPNPIVNLSAIQFEEFGNGGNVASVNAQTGVVVLDTDDIAEGPTNKYSSVAEKEKLSYITISQAVNLDDIETRVNELDAAVILKGTWNPSGNPFPGDGNALAGWSYLVIADGIVDGVEFKNGDRLICVFDYASPTQYIGNWYKADYTDRVNTVAGRTGNIVITSSDLSDFNDSVNALITTALEVFKTTNYLDATSSIQNQIDILNSKVRVFTQTSDIVTSAIVLLDTNLTFSIEPDTTYIVDGVFYGGCNSGGGIRINMSLPIGCTGIHSSFSNNVNNITNGFGNINDINTNLSSIAGASNNQQTRYRAIIKVGNTGGIAKLQFATTTGGQSSTFRTNSNIIVTKK